MFKKIATMLMCGLLAFSMTACSTGSNTGTNTGTSAESSTGAKTENSTTGAEGSGYKIGIITGTVSQGEEEYRAAENMKAKYGDMIVTATYPDNFMKEQETVISQVATLAMDEDVKAIIFLQAVPGASAAIDKVREKRPDMLFICGIPGEDPAMIASKADIVLQPDELGMGRSIAEQAKKMGATKLVHYSFPRHMSYEMLAKRRDIMKATSAELGLEFIEATALDPTGDSGVPGAQQFILEDVPRKIAELGKDTAFFNTNCSMQEPLIKSVLEQGAIFPQQCCPSPYHGYPGALGIEIPEEQKGDISYIKAEITNKVAEKGGEGKMSTWPIPVNMLFVEAGVEYAIAFCEGKTNGTNDSEVLKAILINLGGEEVQIGTYSEGSTAYDNYYLLLSGYLTF